MNFKNKQAMRYGGKSNMATSYRSGGPGDDAKAGTTEEKKMYGMNVSDIDAQIESYLSSGRPETYGGSDVYSKIQDEARRGFSIVDGKTTYSDAARQMYKNLEKEWAKKGSDINYRRPN